MAEEISIKKHGKYGKTERRNISLEQTIRTGWIDYESARQLHENKEVAFIKILFKDPEIYGFQKIDINNSLTESVTDEDKS